MSWTPKERVLAAINHEEPDRVPIDLGGTFASSIVLDAYDRLKQHLGLEHETQVMSKLNQLALPDESVLQRFGVDTRPIMAGQYEDGPNHWVDDLTYIDEFGVTLKGTTGTNDKHFLYKHGPFWGGKLTPERIDAFDWPDPDNPGLVRGIKEQVAAYKAAGDYCLVLNVPAQVIHRAYPMRGMQDFLKDFYKNPEANCYLMDKLADYCIRASQNMIREAGAENVDIVFFGEDLGTQDGCMFDPEGLYARYIKPRHERIVQTLKADTGAKSVFHCCGSAYHFIPHLLDIGVDSLNPVQVTAKNMEPDRLKDEFGDRLAFWGGINSQETLPYHSAAEVEAETKRCIDIFGKQGGYTLTSVHNIQFEVPPENVVAMFDTGLNHRLAS
ncbi:MAG: uroporphyrinogen decarboxylase family protein [Alphaproteobacteria bacterium]|jgi:uroporphyrinogen decarboxylase|nr:uroporphyrinogen decarboxylase family protein [Alphaproteobacteria bacterium]MDP6621412.1 uroporphyrinogen decarboxylase family protein [Alphaproteobacteria bacterium]|tara:strand:- start:283 stop:1434 length:1152 start_codon:yes stop_codon:yes gene_type:complete